MGINNDNRIENLRILCPNCNAGQDTFCRGNIRKRKIVTLPLKKIKSDINISQRKSIRPPYSDLISEIKELGYSAVGRKYNVSDNAIRKWVKYYEKHVNTQN